MKYIENIFAGKKLTKSDLFNPLSANLTYWTNALKQFVGYCRRIVLVGLTILRGWRLKG